jgi:putative spermidine/putrescine transport system permease protein
VHALNPALEQPVAAGNRLARAAGGWLLVGPLLLVLTLWFFLPNLLLVVISFFKYEDGLIVREFTLRNYIKFFSDAFFLKAFGRTLLLGAWVGALAVVIGYPVAYYLVRSRSPWKGLYLTSVLTPLLASIVVRTYGWQVLLEEKGLINTVLRGMGLISEPLKLIHNFTGVLIGLTHVELPYAVLAIMASLQGIDPALERAAMNLRAGPVRTFLLVTLPLSLPGVAAGFLLPFAATISAYASPRILGGRQMDTTGTLVYSYMTDLLDWPFAAAIAVVVVVTVTTALILLARLRAKRVGVEL